MPSISSTGSKSLGSMPTNAISILALSPNTNRISGITVLNSSSSIIRGLTPSNTHRVPHWNFLIRQNNFLSYCFIISYLRL